MGRLDDQGSAMSFQRAARSFHRSIIPPLSRAALLIGLFAVTTAHVGSPNVVFDGTAGPYGVRVIVRPPMVVPGLAEVIVRVSSDEVTRVGIRPVFWRAGVKGSPSPDDITRVAGQTRLYSGHLWLMSRGAYSVYVNVDGARGSGTVIVPVSSFATGRLDLPKGLGAILVLLTCFLVAGLLTIVRAAAGDSLLPPGESMNAVRRRKANIAMAVAAPVITIALFGGASWWSAVDRAYERTMFRPPAADASISLDSTHRTLSLHVHDTSTFRAIFSPVVPDHGKMMHLFLVSRTGTQVFAHLHPVEGDSLHFTTELPWVPAGPYLMFGDIATENGLSLTISTRIDIPPSTGSVQPADPDDAWDWTTRVTPGLPNATRQLSSGGYTMTWETQTPIVAGRTIDLAFSVRDSAGTVTPLHPYLGMAGHAVVVRHDASVFIHLHPMGTIAPVTQRVFAQRDAGDTTTAGRLRTVSMPDDHMPSMPMAGQLSFPYEFPKPGRYRIWVQVKPQDQVLTGAFDVDVR